MRNKTFNQDDLKLCDWQYIIRHAHVNCFKVGEKVFLKSNPEVPLTVYRINENTVTVIWLVGSKKEIRSHDFKPECILQYRDSVLLSYRDIFSICLN